MAKTLSKYRAQIDAAGLFDAAFYAGHSPDVVDAGMDPLEHFIQYGHLEERWPNPRFDPGFYRATHLNGDRRINPLVHYLLEGKAADLPTTRPVQFAVPAQPTDTSISDAIDDFQAFCSATGVFDEDFYLAENRDIDGSRVNAFQHFITSGWQEGRNPSRVFSLEWYRETHLNGDRSINPVWHYYQHGVYAGLSPAHGFLEASDVRSLRKLSRTGRFVYPDSPEVTIAIVNLNGQHHLPDLMASLAELDYPSYRVLLIDNGSTDGSARWMAENAPFADVVSLDDNIGFADAANLALDIAPTQLVAILNNDMTVDRAWLRELVEALKASPQRAAVTSKIRFFEPFVTLSVQSDRAFSLSIPVLLEHFDYKKFFVERGHLSTETIASDGDHVIALKLPCELGKMIDILPETETPDETPLMIRVNGIALYNMVGPTSVQLDAAHFDAAGQWVINNAGSRETTEDIVGDRGFGEYDVGQYETQENVPYLCGGSFLINRTALMGRPLFIGDLFAYYEDTELSVRLRHEGYSIGYAPKSVVYHKHASTSEEKSVFFQRRVERNYSAFFARKRGLAKLSDQVAQKKGQLNHLSNYFANTPDATDRERELAAVYPEVITQIDDMMAAFTSGKEFEGSHRSLRLGVYNTYWYTAGGGELHALNVAHYLSRFGVVDLISERDFDLDMLLDRFRLPRERFRKVLLFPISPEDTAAYDVFVNSTVASNLASRAKMSFYIVSFPHQAATEQVLSTYTFLPNSYFTNHWCTTFWGDRPTALLYPLVRRVVDAPDPSGKSKVILNVGRFFPDGHCKMQHEMVTTFKELVARHPEFSDWKLVCIGGLDQDRDDCLAYFNQVSEAAEGANVALLPNAGFDDLNAAYRDAAIYWHATGFGKDLQANPYDFEHFGISTVEAMSAGCIPVVLDAGGQAEIVNDPSFGSRFDDRQSWIEASVGWMKMFETNSESYATASLKAAQAAERYQKPGFEASIASIFSDVAAADALLEHRRPKKEFAISGHWRSDILSG